MDEYSSRRTTSGLVISRKGSSLILRDSAENNRDGDVQVCSRVGCSSTSSRLNPTKSTLIGSPSKSKTSKAPFHSSSHGKDIIGSSSRTHPPTINTSRKFFSDQKKKLPSYKIETHSETSSGVQDESEDPESISNTSGKAHMRVHPEPHDHELDELGTSGPSNRFVKGTGQKFVWARQDNSQASSSSSFARNSSYASRYKLRNSRCNSVSEVIPPGSSSSSSFQMESSLGRKRDIGRKRIGEPESSSSSAKGKKISGLILDDRRNDIFNSNRGISISDHSRRTRNLNSAGDNDDATSVRARRSNARRGLTSQENRNFRLPMIESPLLIPPSPQPENTSLDASGFSLEDQFAAHNPTSRGSSLSRPVSSSSSEHPRTNRSGSPYEPGFARSFMNRDTLRQFNLDGIAEMLLALERIGHEEEPSYEQLLVLETNLFLGGLSFHDQHRDMRLDIDNMSYEELLALEERMGTVNTAVPEEALTKCLEKGIFEGATDCRGDEDDIKCCICQEEYTDGEEIGRLSCDHRYHIDCIHQWLSLKNWCPICKASAGPK